MPVFGLGSTVDLAMFLLPFAAMWILKKIVWHNLRVAPAGFIVVGCLCLVTQSIRYRYGIYHEGAIAVGLGMFYVLAAGFCLIHGNKAKADGDVKQTK